MMPTEQMIKDLFSDHRKLADEQWMRAVKSLAQLNDDMLVKLREERSRRLWYQCVSWVLFVMWVATIFWGNK